MRTRITAAAAAVAFAGMLAFVAGAPAGAEPGPALSRAASGQFTGTTSYTFNTGGCGFSSPIHQVYDATYGARGASGAIHLDGCVTIATNPFEYNGSFELKIEQGGILSGSVTGTIGGATGCTPFAFVLTVTGGTNRFARAKGSIAVDGTWCFQGNVPAVDDPIGGDLAASLATTSSDLR